MKNKKSFIIGIAGGSGSGKTTFAEKIKETFPHEVAFVTCDNYYLPHDDITLEERDKLNYDSPGFCSSSFSECTVCWETGS